MPKKKVKNTKAKRMSFICYERDSKKDCHLGHPVRFGLKDYMVVITTNREAGLMDSEKKIRMVSWSIWEKKKKKAKNPYFFIWDNEVRRIIKYHSKQIANNLKKIKRAPVLKRTPAFKRMPAKQ